LTWRASGPSSLARLPASARRPRGHPERRTPEGWELQFATNHPGHFALTTGLHEALAAAGGARVAVVSSVGHVNGEVLFDDVNFERHPYKRLGRLQPVQDRERALRRRGGQAVGR